MKTESTDTHVREEISKDRIIDDLRKIGVKEGGHIAVTLSFKSIGHVKGGPEAFIDALLEVVGSNGTIMMNTFTRPPSARGNFSISEIHKSNYVFDQRSTPTWTGLVPETLRKRRNAIRSRHPVCSVTAFGKLAKYLTEGHDEHSSLYEPYSRLTKVEGKYLGIGLENRLVAIRHEAQRLAGLFDIVPFFHGVKYRDNEGKVKICVYNSPPCPRKLPELVPILRKMGIFKAGRIGMAYSMLAPVKDILNAMTEMLKRDPTLTLCDKIYCLWCREAERRLDLYKKIKNPKYFQKYFFVIKTIALINRLRLKKFAYITKS